ncbi:unnamed protein product [Staurois parvus]|uniref:Uncharacterized protein n=1 Tax=Staurois parvus TaxID=386267 RepID=A0ABN9HNL9_9NEOB|nr:unnamed protein product [Staurois parvus]
MVEFCTNQNAHRSFLHLSLVRYTAWKNGDPPHLRPHVVESDPAGQSNNDLGEPPKELAQESPGLQGWKKLLTGDTGEHS